jgi:LytS/YehU family sensor histidine kinase
VGVHTATACLSAALWVGLGRLWASFLARAAGAAPEQALAGLTPALFLAGVLLFLLSAAIHYALGALDALRRTEKRALELQLLSRDAQLQTLRAQIHPHFLFNSLNSIGALISQDPAAARQMCLQLADFLRGALALGHKETISLAQESQLAAGYLAIEQRRFGDRLRFTLDVAPAAQAYPVPPLVLQPLVENAVKHGIATLLEGGTVAISARAEGEAVCVRIDNAFDVDAKKAKGAGLGLEHVRRRLATLYGDDARMRVTAEPGRFLVELVIPGPR